MLQANGLQEVFNVEESKVIEGESSLVPANTPEVAGTPAVVGGVTAIQISNELVPGELTRAPAPELESSELLKDELKKLVELTKGALDNALLMQAEDPTAKNTEAVAKMADTVAKTLQTWINLNQSEKVNAYKAHELNSKQEAPKQVTNNLIVSTNDLIDQILSRTKKVKK